MKRLLTFLLAGSLAASAVAFAACGDDEHELDVPEGHSLELGELSYRVQITRFLNPFNRSDAPYLGEREPPPEGKQYLAVFLLIENESDEVVEIADELTVVDTRENEFEAVEHGDNEFALELGASVPADGQLPLPSSPAAFGPIKGSLVLFLVDEIVTENRPLELEIPGHGETGRVELDI